MNVIKIMLFVLLMPALVLAGMGKYVTYKVNGMDYEGYYQSPSKEAPLVFMIHDWDGLTDYEVKRTEMLNKLGYAVFAADMFGKDVRPTEIKDKKRLTGALYKDRVKMRALLNGAFMEAKKQGGNVDNAVAVGYCFGGAVVLEFARTGADLKAFVPFHGGLKTPKGQNYGKTKGQVLVLHGTADKAVSMIDFANLAMELESNKVHHEMISYSGAPHAFTVFGSQRYHEDADKKSWARFTEFLSAVTK